MEDAATLKNEIESLEPRVERLKSLYQQYFMGIEKIPPNVLRKDVDRTIWRLRKQRFQNTRLRFKFQQIIQRYNTYQQYWKRVMRQIEKGTYQRDVVRAAKRFGETEVVTAAGRRAQAALRRSQPPPNKEEPNKEDKPKQTAWELPDELAGAVLGVDTAAAAADDWEDDAPTPPSNRYKVPQGMKPAMGDPAPPEPELQARAKAHTPEPHLRHEVGGAASTPPPAEAAPVREGALPGGRPKKGALPGGRTRKKGALPGALAGARTAKNTPAPNPGNPPPAPSGPGRPPPPARGSAPGRPPPPARKPPGAKPPDRKRQIYDEYLRARKKAGQPTKGITYEKLARSLDSQTEALRKKHGTDKKVDYEVVTQDGRTLIKPKVK